MTNKTTTNTSEKTNSKSEQGKNLILQLFQG